MDNEIYRLALDQLSSIVFIDSAGLITDANNNFCRIAQYTRQELIGQSFTIIWARYQNQSFSEHLATCVTAGQVWRGEINSRTKDGSFFWLDASVFPLHNAQHQITGYFISCLDITDKKEAEAEIIRQIQQTKGILESNSDGFLSVNADWQITLVNKIFEDTIGVNRDQIIGQNFLKAFLAHKGSRAALATLQQAMLEQQAAHFEYFHTDTSQWFEVNVYPAGNGLVLTFRNVSERKLNAQRVRQSEQLLRAIMQSTPDVFIFVGLDRRVISFNERARKGIRRAFQSELQVGDDMHRYCFEGDPTIFNQSFQKALEGEHVQIERKVILNGQINWYWMTYFPVYDTDGQLIGVALNSSTINNIKYFESEVLRINERFRLVAQATNDAIYDWNIEQNEIKWYEAFYQMFGYTVDKVETTLDWWANHLHPDEQLQVRESLNKALAQKQTNWQHEYRLRCSDGTYKLVFERGYILYSEAGTPLRMIGALQDIQQLKEHQYRISAQNEQLREIAFSQSHEVRRPVANMLGLLKCLNRDELSPENQKIVKMLERTSAELDAIVRKIVNKTYQI